MLRLQRALRKYFYPLRGTFSTLNLPTKRIDMTGRQDISDNTDIVYWHPSYLDWPVLAAFSITFLVLAVGCQVLLYYSNKSYGLTTSYQGLHYLWTYGPTAILTLIASFWARVECQTKISAPWCRMIKGTATSQHAVKNKDYPVAASALVSLLLRLVIVILTSFIVLSPIVVRVEDVEVTLKSRLIALFSKDVSLPEGISAKYAYVTAETDIQNISQLVTTVDAFEGGLHCEPAAVTPVWVDSGRRQDLNCTTLFILPETCNGLNSTYERAIGIVASSVMDTPDSPINITNLSSLFAGDNIVQLISSFYQQYTAILARVSLMKDASTPSTGSAMVSKQRLLVQIIPTHIMTGLLLLSVTMVAVIWRWQSKLFLPQNPNTIIGNAVLLAHNPLHLTGIGSVSVSNLEAILDHWVYRIEVDTAATSSHQLLLCIDQKRPIYKDMDVREMETSTYRPLSLSFTLRSFAFVLIISMIITLDVFLRKSEHNDGIADTPGERSKYQLWTVFPGLLSALISMYSTSVDADTRSQGHLLQLRHGAAFEALSLDFVDRHTFTLLLEEVRCRGFESLASTLAVAITSLLAIFSASLFFATTLPAETHVQLKPNSLIYYNADLEGFYGYPEAMLSNSIGMAILMENASYSAFTYQDLAFPGLVLDGTPPSHFTQSRVVYNVTVPAVRPGFTNCRLYDASQIGVSTDTASSTGKIRLKVVIHPEAGCGITHYEEIFVDKTAHGRGYFGQKYDSTSFGCSTHIWTWGSWTNVSSDDKKAQIRSIHALACNDTIQTVETSVEFIAETMAVNSHNPPITNDVKVINLTSINRSPYLNFYIQLPQIATIKSDADLDPFFTIITGSRYAIPTSYLGDASKVSAVVDSIKFHHSIILVQLLDQQWRYDNRTSVESQDPDIRPVWDRPTVFNATARDPHGRSRVVQDVVSTRVLQSLLAVTLVCLGVNSFLMRNVDVVPRSPTSIANWIALLADGNLYDFLPPNAGHMPLDQISRWYFGQDAVFYLGFRKSPVSGKKVLGIYVVSQHSALDGLVERRSPWYKRLWAFMSAKVEDNKMYVRQARPVE
ncbi:hypothetical protein EKO27_g6811 [Xylaria grammica]|uniref:Uncharacterized protein n=1 Tax=Xylaria grammica TaxID=363999 RepID=A0A439D1X7_9PEZI|nr:hypothetical protein EKO27_g6811 [Xylaria grammica]